MTNSYTEAEKVVWFLVFFIEAINSFYLPGETIDWHYGQVYLVE